MKSSDDFTLENTRRSITSVGSSYNYKSTQTQRCAGVGGRVATVSHSSTAEGPLSWCIHSPIATPFECSLTLSFLKLYSVESCSTNQLQ